MSLQDVIVYSAGYLISVAGCGHISVLKFHLNYVFIDTSLIFSSDDTPVEAIPYAG